MAAEAALQDGAPLGEGGGAPKAGAWLDSGLFCAALERANEHWREGDYTAIYRALQAALKGAVPSKHYPKFATFGLLEDDVYAPEGVLAAAWGLSDEDTRILLKQLQEAGLIKWEAQARRVVLHDLAHDFATAVAVTQRGGVVAAHGALVDRCGASLVEVGATHVPGLPSLDRLQIDAPGVYYHASAGADGTGADGSRQACVTNPACVVGADGGRFNPHQADLDAYADAFSWGYRFVNIVKYESLLPGISLQPFLVFAHDVNGTAPGPGENFIQGRKSVNANFEFRYKSDFSFTVGYNWFWGGGTSNLVADRDNLQLFARYLF